MAILSQVSHSLPPHTQGTQEVEEETDVGYLLEQRHQEVVCWPLPPCLSPVNRFFLSLTNPLKDKHKFWIGRSGKSR